MSNKIKKGHRFLFEVIVYRSLYSIGLMSRYFDLNTIFEDDEEAKHYLSTCVQSQKHKDDGEQDKVEKAVCFTEIIFSVLTTFCRYRDGGIQMKALNALGNFLLCIVNLKINCCIELYQFSLYHLYGIAYDKWQQPDEVVQC